MNYHPQPNIDVTVTFHMSPMEILFTMAMRKHSAHKGVMMPVKSTVHLASANPNAIPSWSINIAFILGSLDANP